MQMRCRALSYIFDCLYFFLYSDGDIPVRLRKIREKYKGLSKPVDEAISLIERESRVFFRSFFAISMR